MRHLKLFFLLFVGFIVLAPSVTYFISGAPKAYGQQDYKNFPVTVEIFKSVSLRESWGDALIERLPLRKTALANRNAALYKLGVVNSPRIISGNSGWLYYKDQFRNNDCAGGKRLKIALERLDVMSSMTLLTGPETLFSVSPNKYSIYSDKAGSMVGELAECYKDNQNYFEQRVNAWGRSNVILHHNTLRLARGDKNLAFRPHDTHWTELGGLYAFDDVLSWLGYRGKNLKNGIQFQLLDNVFDSDLGNSMLLLKSGEDTNVVPKVSQIEMFSTANLLPQGKVLILHDSFYQKISPHIDKLLLNVKRLHYSRDIDKISSALQNVDAVVINIVERSFAIHLTTKTMAWESPVGQEILRRNEIAASQCVFDEGVNWLEQTELKRVQYFNVDVDERLRATPKNSDPIIVFDVSELERENGVCFEMEFEMPSQGKFEVFLQSRDWPQVGNTWVAGRSFYKELDKGMQKIKFIVPTDSQTKFIRVDPIAVLQDFSLKSARLKEYRP